VKKEKDLLTYLLRLLVKYNLKTAIRLFLEEAEKMNTLEDILDEANYKKDEKGKWSPPKLVATEFARL